MKVGITGSHIVGKTSLAHSLVSDLKELSFDVVYLGESAYKCPLPKGPDSIPEAQIWILTNQICGELETEYRSSIVISERTVIDNYMYFLYDIKMRQKAFTMGNGRYASIAQMLEELVIKWAKTYDLIFKLPTVPSQLKPYGLQKTSEYYQQDIEKMLMVFLNNNNIEYKELPSITKGARSVAKEFLLNFLENKSKK